MLEIFLSFVIGTRSMCLVMAINKLNRLDNSRILGWGPDFKQFSSFLNFSRVICFPLPQYLRPKWGSSELLDLPPTALSSGNGVISYPDLTLFYTEKEIWVRD